MFTENTVWKAVERLINANADNDSDGLSPYESGYINGYNDALLLKIERRWQKRLTVIKQKAVSSSRHAKNVRKYINGKDALARGGWNLPYNKYWYAKMARTRKSFGHDKPARAGAKNTIMYHQVLAFLPEECSCNGGKMTPDACMAYAEQWLAKHYPHQQVILALHEESDKEGKRFAVHMAINRTDLLTGKRLWEGTGAQAKHKRASWVADLVETVLANIKLFENAGS